MLCAKYDYKMDIAVKQEEAYEDGLNAGLKQGIEQGRVQGLEQTAINLLKMHKLTNEQIAQVTGLPLEKVLELASKIS